MGKKKNELMTGLTKRELEVHALVAKGKSNKEIATELNLAVKTVKFHITNIFKKIGVKTRANLIIQHLT